MGRSKRHYPRSNCHRKRNKQPNDMIPVFDPSWGKSPNPRTKKRLANKTHLGWKWWRLRKEWLRDNPFCNKCGLFGEEVHHILPRHTHPNLIYDRTNLMTLCKVCHYKEHQMGEYKEGTHNVQDNQLPNRPDISPQPDRHADRASE